MDDEPIFWSELSQRLRELPPGDAGEPTAARAGERVDQMIDEILIRRAADRASVVVTGEEVDDGIHHVREQNRLSLPRFAQALQDQHIDPAAYARHLRRQMLRMKVLNLHIGPIEIAEEELGRVGRDRVATVPEADRLPFAEAREALLRELMNARGRGPSMRHAGAARRGLRRAQVRAALVTGGVTPRERPAPSS